MAIRFLNTRTATTAWRHPPPQSWQQHLFPPSSMTMTSTMLKKASSLPFTEKWYVAHVIIVFVLFFIETFFLPSKRQKKSREK